MAGSVAASARVEGCRVPHSHSLGDDEMNAALGQVAASHLKAAYAEAPAFLKEANHKLLAANAPPYARLLKKKEKKVEEGES